MGRERNDEFRSTLRTPQAGEPRQHHSSAYKNLWKPEKVSAVLRGLTQLGHGVLVRAVVQAEQGHLNLLIQISPPSGA